MNPVYGPSKTRNDSGEETGLVPEDQKKRKLGVLDAIGYATGAIAAFQLLEGTDLKAIGGQLLEAVKNPVLAAIVAGLYVYLGASVRED